MFQKDIAILAGAQTGEQLGKVATGITYLFGAMACYIGLVGFAVGCCYTKCHKLSKVCACIVSFLVAKTILFSNHCIRKGNAIICRAIFRFD